MQREFHLVHWLAAHLKLPGTRPGHLGVLRGPVLASNVKLPGTRPGHFEKRRLDSLLSPRSRAEKKKGTQLIFRVLMCENELRPLFLSKELLKAPRYLVRVVLARGQELGEKLVRQQLDVLGEHAEHQLQEEVGGVVRGDVAVAQFSAMRPN